MRARSVSCTSLRANELTDGTSRATRAVALLAAIVSIAFSVVAPPSPRGGAAPLSSTVSVIVRAQAGSLVQTQHAVRLVGGVVGQSLPIIEGFAAQVPSGKLPDLQSALGAGAVELDAAAEFNSAYDPMPDPNSQMYTARGIGATAAWAAGATGAGVDVALIDTGVTPVEGLAANGKLISGPDLTFESQIPALAHLDGYGHGTFMAGLIAGRDRNADPANPGSQYLGIAPDARVVSVKVGAADGSVHDSQVIAGIGWVVAHQHDNGLNIRILNLSLGRRSAPDYQRDPLAQAAEVAWRSGLVVVSAAGNDGRGPERLSSPAIDPHVIAVGAESAPSYGSLAGAAVSDYSNFGDGRRNPDLIAPGSHIQGLRVPGSYIDQKHPDAALGERFFRGSGTSEATALVSGAAALLLQRQPQLRPDEVKSMLDAGAARLPGISEIAQGAGVLQLGATLAMPLSDLKSHLGSSGSGEEGSQQSGHDSQQFNVGGQWAGTTWTGTTWTGTTWTGTTWTGTTWTGTTWTGTTWTGTTWTGTTWTGTTWTGTTWTNMVWAGYWGS